MPTSSDGLVNHGFLGAYRAFVHGLVSNLTENMSTEGIGVSTIVSRCCETLDQRLQVHVICKSSYSICCSIGFLLLGHDIVIADKKWVTAGLTKPENLCENT